MNSKKENRHVSSSKSSAKSEESKLPYIRIVEQPKSRGLRFRYECEQRFRNAIEGENSKPKKETYPTIEIVNNKGPAFVVVSCVTAVKPYRPHPHSLNGRGNEFSRGICYMKVPAGKNIIKFPGMIIECVKKAQIESALEERKRLKVNPFMTKSPVDFKTFDMSCVRLCFQVFLEGKQKGNFNVPLKPIVSQPIYDKKMSVEFKIHWISHHSASVAGGEVICIISDKLVKGDIQVKFVCEKRAWEATAQFESPSFHGKVAVIVKTPAYLDLKVTKPVDVRVKLYKPSTGATSLSVPFQLLPVESTIPDSQRAKRLRLYKNPRPTRAILEQHTAKENDQASPEIPRNVTVSKKTRIPKAQHSKNQKKRKSYRENSAKPAERDSEIV